jgi:hypothetical protein
MESKMTRRTFVKTSAVTAAALAVPRIILGDDKSGLKSPVVGTGEHTYECIHDWGQLPPDIAYGNTHGVCEDAKGNIYIKHTVHATSSKADAVVVFDPEGKFVRSWGPEYRGGAHGLHISKEKEGEFLYLCDQARGVVDKTTLTGEKVWSKTCPMESGLYNAQGEYHPTNIAIVPGGAGAPAGEFYIADGYGKSWIHHYNTKGEYLKSWGGKGADRGQMNCPHGLMIDTRGTEPVLVVADRANNRLQYFTLNGKHIKFVKDDLKLPCHFHTRGDVMVVPDLEARVTLLDKDNKLITQLGDGGGQGLRDKAREQFIPGKFITPHSAIFDHAGNIFVVEWVEVGRVTKLRRVG